MTERPDPSELLDTLEKVLTWPNPSGTIEEYYLPVWLKQDARAALEELREQTKGRVLRINFEGAEPGLAIFAAAGRVLREAAAAAEAMTGFKGGETAYALLRADTLTEAVAPVIEAADELRAAFDRYIPGWDSPAAEQSWN